MCSTLFSEMFSFKIMVFFSFGKLCVCVLYLLSLEALTFFTYLSVPSKSFVSLDVCSLCSMFSLGFEGPPPLRCVIIFLRWLTGAQVWLVKYFKWLESCKW